MKHTPGPWRINDMPLPHSKIIEIGPCQIKVKERGKAYSIKQVSEETQANARLISAAPELLEMVKTLVGTYNDALAYKDMDLINAFEDAECLIKKIEGG
jgi:hypothetical protein